MSQQPESGPPVLKLYAIELPDGSIAMNGPYVLATENEGQAGRMAHARDGQEIAFVRELQQAQGVGELSPIHYMRDNHTFKRLSEHVPTAMVEIEQEFNSGYTCGMLCSKRPGFVSIHANGNKNRMEFLKACEDRLKQQAATPQSSATQQAQVVGESGLDDLCQRLSEHGAKSGRRAATKRYNDGVPTHTEMLMGQAVDAIRRLATPQSSAPVVGERKPLTRAEIAKGWEETFVTTNPFCPCDLKSFDKAVRWAESALTGRGSP